MLVKTRNLLPHLRSQVSSNHSIYPVCSPFSSAEPTVLFNCGSRFLARRDLSRSTVLDSPPPEFSSALGGPQSGFLRMETQYKNTTKTISIHTLSIRQRTLANAFAGRLMSTLDDDNATARQKLQAKKTQIALNSSEAFQRIVPLVTKPLRKDQTMSMRQNIREVISRTMGRPVPIPTRLPPALQLKSMKHRALACRWHLGVFPVHFRYLYRPTHIPG